MKKLFLILLVIWTIIFASDKVRARIDNKVITDSDIEHKIDLFPSQYKSYYETEAGRKSLLNQIVKERLYYMDAMSKGYDDDPEIRKRLETIKRELVVNKYLKALLANVTVSETKIKKYYNGHQSDFQKIKASHILLKSKQKADDVYKKAIKGDDFAELAKKYSTGPSSKKGGDLGWFGKGAMVKPFEKAAFALKKGEISKPIKTTSGYHIIKCTDISRNTTYNSVAADIRKILLDEKRNTLLESTYKKLKGKHTVKIEN